MRTVTLQTASDPVDQIAHLGGDHSRVLGAVLEASPDCIKLIEIDGSLSFVSQNGLCLLEVENFELLRGLQWTSLWPSEHRARVERAFASAVEGRPDRFTAWCPTGKGSHRCWDVAVSPVRAKTGEVERVLAVSRDVTELALPPVPEGKRPARPEMPRVQPLPEADRMAALRDLDVLDSEPDAELDAITTSAAQFFRVKSALISLVDTDRQWFLSRCNFTETETGRDVAFCDHTIREPGRVMVIEDTSKDARFADNPLTKGENGIAFYAGAPLLTRDGAAIGTLCVIDTEPRRFTKREEEALRLFASNAITRIELAKRDHQINTWQVAVREMKHRMKNTYAQFAALLNVTKDSEDDKEALIARLKERITLLARAQAHILASDYEAADIEGLMRELIGDQTKIELQSEKSLPLTDSSAFSIALAISELVSNARKYGALADDNGKVDLRISGYDPVHITWHERFDRPRETVPQSTHGFGRRILNEIVPKSLAAEASSQLDETSLIYALRVPRNRLVPSGF